MSYTKIYWKGSVLVVGGQRAFGPVASQIAGLELGGDTGARHGLEKGRIDGFQGPHKEFRDLREG
jgi:hypothetical protein